MTIAIARDIGAFDAAYQGQPGAYSEEAARCLCGATSNLLACETLADVFAALVAGRSRAAVIPIENTLAGAVPGALRLLLDSDSSVDAEVTEWIDHVLAGPPGATLETIREVLSHPVALAQCTGFFKAHPHIRAVPVFDTAGAIEMVVRAGWRSQAAIAGRTAAVIYGASILAEHLQDHQENYTRFVRVVRAPAMPIDGRCRVMLSLRLSHRPGSLAEALRTLADCGLNLTRIDSSPIPGCPFEYEFLLEATSEGHIGAAIEAMQKTMSARLIGCFAATSTQDASQ